MLTLSDLQKEVATWTAYNFPNATPFQPLLGVIEEVGELSHAVLKSIQGIRGTPEEHKAAMEDAVADTVIYLADFCNRNDINLEIAEGLVWVDKESYLVLLEASIWAGNLASDFRLKSKGGMYLDVGRILSALEQFCKLEDIDFYGAIDKTWGGPHGVSSRDWVRFPNGGFCPACGEGLACSGHDPVPAEPTSIHLTVLPHPQP